MTPKLSVIIPTLNGEGTLRACLDSLAHQKSQDFDIWIIDGGSSDTTLTIASSYLKTFASRLHISRETDKGVYYAMNRAIGISKGSWLLFLGSDDTIADDTVFLDIDKHLTGDLDLVYGDVILSRDKARYGGKFSLERLLFEQNLCQQSVFYSRTLFNRLGCFSTQYPVWADWEFNVRCFRYPEIKAKWVERIISIYNNASGISVAEDIHFRRELPVKLHEYYKGQIDPLKQKNKETEERITTTTNALSYKFFKKIFGWPDLTIK